MLQFEPFLSLLLALFAGLLIGLERQQNATSDTSGPEILGGVRTHPLVPIGRGLLYVPAEWVRPAQIEADALTSIYLSMGIVAPPPLPKEAPPSSSLG